MKRYKSRKSRSNIPDLSILNGKWILVVSILSIFLGALSIAFLFFSRLNSSASEELSVIEQLEGKKVKIHNLSNKPLLVTQEKIQKIKNEEEENPTEDPIENNNFLLSQITPQEWFHLALIGMKQKKNQVAKARFKMGISQNYELGQSFMFLGMIEALEKNKEQSLKFFKKAFQHSPQSSLLFLNWGDVLRTFGDYPLAIEKFEAAQKLSPNTEILEFKKLLAKIENGEIEKISSLAKKRLAEKGAKPYYHMVLAATLIQNQKFLQAANQISTAKNLMKPIEFINFKLDLFFLKHKDRDELKSFFTSS